MRSMPFLGESQQSAVELLVELRRLVSAHGEFLAKFGQQTRTEEASDSLDKRSPPHQSWHTRPPDQQPATAPPRRWSPPPSVTQAPLGFNSYSLPRLHLEPPRFAGEMALDWIRKVQEYYNHHYTPLDDRLYLTKYLFDHPASTWMAYWEENNKGKGWDEFLIAVKQRFAPDLHDEHVGSLPALRQTSSVDVVPPPPAPVDPIPSLEEKVTAQDFEVEDEKQEINTAHSISSGFEVADHSPPPMPSVFAKSSVFTERVEVSDSSRSLNDLSPSIGAVIRTTDSKTRFHMTPVKEVDATGKYNPSTSTVPSPMPAASPTTTRIKLKCDVEGDDDPPYVEFAQPIKDPRLEQALAADGRSIPPRNVVTRLDRSFSTSWRALPPRTANASSFDLFQIGVAAPSVVSTKVLRAVRQRCEQTYYPLALDDTNAYKLHEDEHGKDYISVWHFRTTGGLILVFLDMYSLIMVGFEPHKAMFGRLLYGGSQLRALVQERVFIFDPGDLTSTSTLKTSHSYSYFITHLEGKVDFNRGRVDRALDLANLAQDRIKISPNLQRIF